MTSFESLNSHIKGSAEETKDAREAAQEIWKETAKQHGIDPEKDTYEHIRKTLETAEWSAEDNDYVVRTREDEKVVGLEEWVENAIKTRKELDEDLQAAEERSKENEQKARENTPGYNPMTDEQDN